MAGGLPVDAARRRRVAFWTCLVALFVLFANPLSDLVRFAWDSSLYSHTPLIPFLSAYLIWTRRADVPAAGHSALGIAAMCSVASAALLATYFAAGPFTIDTSLAFTLGSFVLLVIASVAGFLGAAVFRFCAFPLSLLFFMLPFPTSWLATIDLGLQHGSAVATYGMFKLARMPFLYSDLVFRLPGISLQIAPECSGIRSTLVLLITSLVASQWFLRGRWTRIALVAFVIPLALLRNGFRVFTLGELCVHVSPKVLDSPLHHQGGPIFFALSLIPFAFALWLLRRREARSLDSKAEQSVTNGRNLTRI